jgi:hypothetical protein
VKSPGEPPEKKDEEGKKDACRRFPGEGKTKPLMFCGNTKKRRRARVRTHRVIFLAAGGRPCKPGRLRRILLSKYAAAIVVAVSLLLRGWRLHFYSDEGEVQRVVMLLPAALSSVNTPEAIGLRRFQPLGRTVHLML